MVVGKCLLATQTAQPEPKPKRSVALMTKLWAVAEAVEPQPNLERAAKLVGQFPVPGPGVHRQKQRLQADPRQVGLQLAARE